MPCLAIANGFPLRVLDQVSSMLAYWDKDLTCKYANCAYGQWFGIDGKDLVGVHISELLGPKIFALNSPFILGALAGQPQTFERLIPGPDGVLRNSLARYHPDISDGIVQGFVVEVTDVGPIKVLEAALREEIGMKERALRLLENRQRALETAQEMGNIGSWLWEVESDVSTWSTQLYRIFGLNPLELPPPLADCQRFYTPAGWTALQAAIFSTLAHGLPYEMQLEFFAADGRSGWIEVKGQAQRGTDELITSLFGTVQDITLTKRQSAALQNQAQRLELALAAGDIGSWEWDRGSGNIVWENQRALDILGIENSRRISDAKSALTELIHVDDVALIYDGIASLQSEQHRMHLKIRIFRCSDHAMRWVEVTAKYNPSSLHKGVVGTISDISDQIKAYEAMSGMIQSLKQAESNKTDFLATLGHELKNFLAPISVGVQTLSILSQDSERARVSALVMRQVADLTRLVDDVYDVRRLSHGQISLEHNQVDVNLVVRDAVELIKSAIARAGHTLHVELDASDLQVVGDRVRLIQALLNLLNNACKFTPSGGRIDVSTSVADCGHVTLTVADTGIGIPSHLMPAIFDLYVQGIPTTYSCLHGLGIGLYLVKGIVELHGGTVTARNRSEPAGAIFIIELPTGRD